MSILNTDEYEKRILEETEMTHNIQMINHFRNKGESPCKLFYQFKKGIPLSVFLNVYPFNELVDCGSGFNLSELNELKRLYSTLDENYQQRYIDSFHNLEQIILESKYPPVAMFSSEPSTSAIPVPTSTYSTQPKPNRYDKDFQSFNERVAVNKELQDIIHKPNPSQREISQIEYQNYMQNRIQSPQPQQSSFFGKVRGFFGFGGKKRKTIKFIKSSRSRSRSRSHHRRYKKSRSYSRSKK